MTRISKLRAIAALLLAALFLLLPCSCGLTDPIGEMSEGEVWAPSLTEAEAEAMFGHSESQARQQIDGDYLYYTARLRENSDKYTVYRYNILTGEIQYACQDTTCPHTEGSECPFANVSSSSLVCPVDGGVVYNSWLPEPAVCFYDPQTGDYKTVESENAVNIFKAGDHVYYDCTGENPDEIGEFRKELWRVDTKSGKSTLAGVGSFSDTTLRPFLLNGEETVVAFSWVDPEGKFDQLGGCWLYRVNGENKDRTLLYAKKVPSTFIGVWGKYFYYCDYESYGDGSYSPFILHLVDSTTGEDQIIEENSADDRLIVMTDRYMFLLKDDPTGKNAYMLDCYEYHTGQRKEYPLQGEKWDGSFFSYYRGMLFMTSTWMRNESGEITAVADVVCWDIVSGKQNVIGKRKPKSFKPSGGVVVEDTFARTLTDEEAEERFGRIADSEAPKGGGQYVYFLGTHEGVNNFYRTLCRYHIETGEIEIVCKKPGCPHTEESDCPFIGVNNTTDIYTLDGEVVFSPDEVTRPIWDDTGSGDAERETVAEGGQIKFYDPETGECRSFDLHLGEWSRVFKAGDAIYYTRESGDPLLQPGSCEELWRLDPASGEPTLVIAITEENDYSLNIMPCILNGKETVIRNSKVGMEGEILPGDNPYFWLYRVDVESGEQTLLCDRPVVVSDFSSGNSSCIEYVEMPQDEMSQGIRHLFGTSTGEDQEIDDATRLYTVVTDRCILWLEETADGDGVYTLHCDNYLTGEKTEYPLHGSDTWESGDGEVMYYRGQLYLFGVVHYEGEMPKNSADLVVWDIASGAQRLIYFDKITEEH